MALHPLPQGSWILNSSIRESEYLHVMLYIDTNEILGSKVVVVLFGVQCPSRKPCDPHFRTVPNPAYPSSSRTIQREINTRQAITSLHRVSEMIHSTVDSEVHSYFIVLAKRTVELLKPQGKELETHNIVYEHQQRFLVLDYTRLILPITIHRNRSEIKNVEPPVLSPGPLSQSAPHTHSGLSQRPIV